MTDRDYLIKLSAQASTTLAAQRKYFSKRTQENLITAKYSEKALDDLIRKVNEFVQEEQLKGHVPLDDMTLFGSDDID